MPDASAQEEFDCDPKFDDSEVFIDSAMSELQYPALQSRL
jgi:hypothetical protein